VKYLLSFVCLLACQFSFGAADVISENQNFLAGFASVDISPTTASLEENSTYMGGYGFWTARGKSKGIHDPLEANAMCLQSNENKNQHFCLVVVDSLGLTGLIIERIRKRATSIVGLSSEVLFVAATHTHAAPDLLGLWGGAADYEDQLIQGAVSALVKAYKNMEPADLFYSLSEGKAFNRRGWGFTDAQITLITALGQDQKSIGTFVNFSAHPVVTTAENLLLSSDYPHYLRQRIQSQLQGPVLYVNGAIGDVNPQEFESQDMWSDVETYGESIANLALNSLKDKKPISSGIEVKVIEFRSRVENTTLALAQYLGIIEDNSSGPFWNVLVMSRVGRIRLGQEVDMVAIPGEASTRMGLKIKDKMTTPAKVILGLTGGSLGYFIQEDEWQSNRNNNYEESVSIGSHIGSQIERLLQRM